MAHPPGVPHARMVVQSPLASGFDLSEFLCKEMGVYERTEVVGITLDDFVCISKCSSSCWEDEYKTIGSVGRPPTDFAIHPTLDHVDVPNVECAFLNIEVGVCVEGQCGRDEG